MRLILSLALCLTLGFPALAETPAERGYRALLEKPLGPPFMTEAEYFDLWQTWPEPLQTQARSASPEQRRQMALSRYGFQESPDRPGPIPQQFTPDGKGTLFLNCLACHGGPVEGKVIRGLGNSLFDEATFAGDVAKLRLGRGEKLPAPPPPLMPEAGAAAPGVNNAWGTAINYMLVRDLDMNPTIGKPQFTMPTAAQLDIPVDTPPFWLAKKKTRFYYDTFVTKSHRDIMQFSLGYTQSREDVLALEETFKDIFAWIEFVPAPAYPRPLDQGLAAEGMGIYLNHCSRCHGTYGPGGTYPERVVPLSEVGTDAVRLQDFPAAFAQHLGASWVGNYGKTPLYKGSPGYLAQPLDGVWASAPYLHNGSVPTLWHLLTPEARPEKWSRTEKGYDHARVGVELVEGGVSYDTGKRGLGNQGHSYPPEGLTEPDKKALLEYLKSL